MSAFEKTVKNGDYFYYQVGGVVTKKVWTKPTYEKIKNFLTAIQNETSIMSEFELYLMGGTLIDFDSTWDVDICMTGEVKSYEELESHLNTMYDIALNRFQLLIDVQWNPHKPKLVSYQELMSGQLILNKIKFLKIGYIKKQINGEITIKDYRNDEGVQKVNEYLIEGLYDEYPGTKKKLLERILSNPNKLIKSYFSANTLLETDEEYFINNTNRI
jgi:hypothetical protein